MLVWCRLRGAPLADVLGNPSKLHAACVRAANALSGPHEGIALVEALAMLAAYAPAKGAKGRGEGGG